MQDKTAVILCTLCILSANTHARSETASETNSTALLGKISTDVSAGSIELVRYENEFSSVRIEPARMDSKPGLAVIFEGTDDLHYYAKPQTAPAPGSELQIEAKSDSFEFGKAVFPKWEIFQEPTGAKVEVYVGRFTVFVPIKSEKVPTEAAATEIEVKISGIACTSMLCLPPFEKTLETKIDFSQSESWKEIIFETAGDADEIIKGPSYSAWFALSLAFLAGLILNIMPCVWPVLPLIVMRIVEQAKQSKGKSTVMGLAFCLGILLFFASLAGANIILRIFYGTVLQ